jgi:AmmeMemoRadiSam system protein B
MYSGHVAGAVYSRIVFPKRLIALGVRHFPHGEEAAILSEGAWRTPLGDVPVDSELAATISRACLLLREDSVAPERAHSLEVQLPFLQVLNPLHIRSITSARFTRTSLLSGARKYLSAEPDVLLSRLPFQLAKMTPDTRKTAI